MPSKKKNTRAAQLQPQPVQSDYDTDTANMTEPAPALPPPPVRTNTELNIAVLRRYVPDIERIIAIAPFAVVYNFSPETQGWDKSGQEGTLFVCQLSPNEWGYSRYSVVMLNRKSLDNFITELFSAEDVEVTEQYVILQVQKEDGPPDIYGLWIFSDDSASDTRQLVVSAIQECAVRAELARSAQQADEDSYANVPDYNLDGANDAYPEAHEPQVQPDPIGGQIDLLSLFNKPAAVTNNYPQADPTPPQPQVVQPSRFVSNADTDFFRTSRSPAAVVQQQSQPPPQQNALLDLFKSAKNG